LNILSRTEVHESHVIEAKPRIFSLCTEPLQKPDFRVVVRLAFPTFDAGQRGKTYSYRSREGADAQAFGLPLPFYGSD
jgi:hypothetical protein